MKLVDCPEELPFRDADYTNFEINVETARMEAHKRDLKAWLIKSGHNGKHTGKIIKFSVADGTADYMFADGKTCFLVHLPYFDGYRYPDAQYFPQDEILRRGEAHEKIQALFANEHAKQAR